MARNTPEKNSGTGGKYSNKKSRVVSDRDAKPASGDNRIIVLALTGFTALAILVLVVFALLPATGAR
ncbi:hypothetical protein [Rubrobacter indicoceani]|uniref:hypothetical protein n=1 Tax=Rubrobacter indicoceani TaxID=2051957 RepID=UPI000E5ABF1F|nr:hypothetical protein [Rubrobacter indicoceani]